MLLGLSVKLPPVPTYLASNVDVESNLNNGFVDFLNSLTEGELRIANAFFLPLAILESLALEDGSIP